MNDITVIRDNFRFTTSDGVEISVDRHRSAGEDGPAPCVLTMLPYLKESTFPGEMPIERFTREGYVCLIADVRGTGESGGVFLGPLSPREITDYAELVEWTADQDFCSGAVATTGVSYYGANQLLLAARRPRGLVAIAPGVAPIDVFRDWTHRGGIPSHVNWAALTFLAARQPTRSVPHALQFYYGDFASTPVDDERFHERSPVYALEDIEVPVFFLGGLFDFFARGTMRGFERVRSPKRLLIGPWGHQNPDDTDELSAWMAYWLKGEGDDPTTGDNVTLWAHGADAWSTHAGLPSVERRISVDLTGLTVPVVGGPMRLPLQDLPLPVPFAMDTSTDSGLHLWGESTRHALALDEGSVVSGVIHLVLEVTAEDAADLDLLARLSLVGADGAVVQLTEARQRLSHRDLDEAASRFDDDGTPVELVLSHRAPRPLRQSETTSVILEFLPTRFVIEQGDMLRLGLSAVRTDGRTASVTLELREGSRVVLPATN
ncbi:CocE/NonD family hydrolase [Microbacterium mangrovi]|uniref:CocE/NonD family hydrolase n=1 Tax=Microbacterium mangrovi TaxID=1348253 RepID=UPI000690717C|nr:CocE/NonD family hydrolase [Microbacterium mangrovi]